MLIHGRRKYTLPKILKPGTEKVLKPGTEIIISATAPAADAVYFHWDFEATNGGFQSSRLPGQDGWEWGVPTHGPAAAHSGTKLWGTDLDDDYNDSSLYTLDSRAYSINEAGAALGFYHWRDIENSYDGGNVKISIDGGANWTLLVPDGGIPTMPLPV